MPALPTAGKTVAKVSALMEEHTVPVGLTYRTPEILDDPYFAAREAIVEVPDARWGQCKDAEYVL